MKTHTSGFKNNIKEFGRELDSKITYELNGETIELGNEELNSVTPHYKSALLKSTMKQLDIDSNVEIPEGTIINYQFGVKVGNTYEYLNYGNYIVYSIEKQEDKYSYMIKCYDKMLYAMKDYEAMEITYPITVRDFISAICNKVGLTFKNANEQFANYNKEIPKELYLSTEGTSIGYTFRDVLDELAEATASNICINEEDDELEIRYIKDAGTEAETTGNSIEITDGEESELINFELEGKTTQESTPTPSNPSELVSVGYENLTELSNYNVNITNNYFENKLLLKNFENNTTYTLSFDINVTVENFIIGIGYGDDNSYRLDGLAYITNQNNGHKTITFTTNNTTYKNIWLRIPRYGTQVTVTGEVTNIILTKGTQQHNYIPYGKYGIEVKINGNNLKDNATWYSGYLNNNNQVISNSSWKYSDYIDISNGKYNYTSAGTGNAPKTVLYNQNKQPIAYLDIAVGTTDLSSYNASYIRISVANDAFSGLILKRQASTYLYTLDNPLRSIGDTKDLLYIKNGMLYVDRKIGKITFDGSSDENWKKTNDTGISGFYFDNAITVPSNSRAGLSNYFKYQFANAEGKYYMASVSRIVMIMSETYQTADAFKTWLSTHNTEVQYVLATPYTEELGSVDMPSTYEGITYINTTDTNEPTMNITYMSEFEEIDEEYLKDVNVNFGEKYGPVNTVILSRSGGSDKIAQSIPNDIADEDKTAIEIIDNQIMNDNNRADFIPEILNKLNGLEYYINDFTSTGICYLDLCDRYRVKVFDNTYRCIMLNNEVNITQGLEESIYTEKPEETDTEYKYTSSDDRKINQTYIIAKKNEGTIEAVVEAVSGEEGLTQRIERVETKQTSTDFRINAISRNVTYTDFDEEGNPTNSKINQVETTTGFTFNAEGMTIEDSSSNFKALHRNDGTYYKEGNNIVGQYTKDGSKQKDLELFGVYYYGKNDFPDTPMFIAQIFTDENGEAGFGHFYNRGD